MNPLQLNRLQITEYNRYLLTPSHRFSQYQSFYNECFQKQKKGFYLPYHVRSWHWFAFATQKTETLKIAS